MKMLGHAMVVFPSLTYGKASIAGVVTSVFGEGTSGRASAMWYEPDRQVIASFFREGG
jgi:hypothetical protein